MVFEKNEAEGFNTTGFSMKYLKTIGRTVLLFSFIFIITSSPIAGQTESIDSLSRELYLTLDKERQIVILNQLAYKLRESDPVKAMEYAEVALTHSRQLNNREEIGAALSLKGLLLERRNEYTSALTCYVEALDIYREAGNNERISYLYYLTGMVYKTLGNYDKALEQSLSGLRVSEAINDKRGIALIYRVMGSIYKYKGEYEKSLYYYYNGLKINEEINDLQGVANSYNNIGIIHFLMQDRETALDYYRKSLQLNRVNNNEADAAINIGNIGTVYLEMNEMDSAWYYLNLRYESAVRLNNRRRIATAYQSFGDFYMKQKKFDLSHDYYIQSLKLARELGVLETCKDVLLSISEVHAARSEYDLALENYKSHIALRDSLFNNETLQRFEQMELDYLYDTERNANLLKQQRVRLYTIVGFASLILSILFLLLIYMNQRIKLKRKSLVQKNLEFEKQQLQFEVDFKNREMFSKAINLVDKTELINDIARRLKELNPDSRDCARSIKQITKDLEFHANTKIWDEFEYTFLKIHPGFLESLESQYSNLTPNEKRLCAFIRLNFSTKDIASITRQTNHSLTVARTRLRKKLGLSNSGESLTTFLSKF